MDVELFIYDLSKGLARQFSMGFLGTQIDAVYHTSLVFGNVEYFFGAGVQTCYPGSTHHGQPMRRVKLGRTELDLPIILEYLDSLKTIYTAESYDLFMHNCNNFSNDFAMFLIGKGIPDYITSLPQTVLDTPFGQMLKPQLDQAMRGITQAPVAPSSIPQQKVTPPSAASKASGQSSARGRVHDVASLSELRPLLESAKDTCAAIFFTSSTCAPCKICYAPYSSLAEEFAGKITLIKVDISLAYDIAASYQVRATPTFLTFLKGERLEEWSGADPSKLNGNIRLLVQMAHPPHPHAQLKLPTLQGRSVKPDLYTSVPPLEKLVAKLGSKGQGKEVESLKGFVETRQSETAANARLPDLAGVSSLLKAEVDGGQTPSTFALIDLVRVAAIDPRVSGYFAEEALSKSGPWSAIRAVVDWSAEASTATKLVTVQLACNLFSTPLLARQLAAQEGQAELLVRLTTWLLLDESRLETRRGAVSVALNIIKLIYKRRTGDGDLAGEVLDEGLQVELAACLLEALQREQDAETLRSLLLAVGLLVYCCPQDGELPNLLASLDAAATVKDVEAKLNKEAALVQDVVKVVS